ncbi:hypothetical protein GR268_45600, partial [Rhizobium leguminosarum]|nr:hypothetical protein [Rhizobium leguminosarum]
FQRLCGVVVNKEGHIFVADSENHWVQVWRLNDSSFTPSAPRVTILASFNGLQVWWSMQQATSLWLTQVTIRCRC